MAAMPGGLTPVPEFGTRLDIECLARFAVDEYNIKENALVLEFKKVLYGEQQVVAGVMYYLTLELFNRRDKKKRVYEAKVWVKAWMNFKEVEEFKPIPFPK